MIIYLPLDFKLKDNWRRVNDQILVPTLFWQAGISVVEKNKELRQVIQIPDTLLNRIKYKKYTSF